MFIKSFFIGIITLITVTAAASSLKVDGFNAKVDFPQNVKASIKTAKLQLSWYCRKGSISSSNWKSCGEEYTGDKSVTIDLDGNFSFPDIDISGPAFRGVFILGVSIELNGMSSTIETYGGKGFFANHNTVDSLKADINDITIIKIPKSIFPVIITAIEQGHDDIEFSAITKRYPHSYNERMDVELNLIYDMLASIPRTRAFHQTFSKQLNAQVSNQSVIFPETLWAIKGFQAGENIAVSLSSDIGIGIVKSENGSFNFKKSTFNGETTIQATSTLELPSDLLENIRNVELLID